MRHYTRAELERVYEHILGDLLPGATPQGVMVESAAQRHRLGARLVEPRSGRTFRYVQADADRQLRASIGVMGTSDYQETGTVAAIVAIGSTTLTLTAVAAVAANEYAEGLLSFGGGGTSLWGEQYRIRGNTIAAVPGAVFTVTLWDPLITALTAADIATIYQNPWQGRVVSQRQRQIDGIATDWRLNTVVGVPNRYVQAGFFCWIQVKGPCMVMGDSGTEGTALGERFMCWGDNGSVLRLDDAGVGQRNAYAGTMLPVTGGGNQPNGIVAIHLDIPGG